MTNVLPNDPGRHFDQRGIEVTDYVVQTTAVRYESSGRIVGSVTMGRAYIWEKIAGGESLCTGDGDFDYKTMDWLNYVDLSGEVPVIRPRPDLGLSFEEAVVKTGQEAVVRGVPAGTVRFSGPISGEQDHQVTGDLMIGFRVPGNYEVMIDPFPGRPTQLTLTVEG